MKNFIAIIVCLFSVCGYAQDKVEGSAGVDVVSRYIWRGMSLGDASIQPSAGLSYKGLSISAWGSYDILNTKSDKELDLTLSYSTGGFNIGMFYKLTY